MRTFKGGKGHIVVEMTKEEMLLNFEGTQGICDDCLSSLDTSYFIPVLNWLMCKTCCDEWLSTAEYYPEDAPVESKRYHQFRVRSIAL